MKKLLIVANVDWFFISHRLVIAREAVKQGWKVYVACEDTGRGNEIAVDGIEYIPLSFSRSGTNPVKELATVSNFIKLYREVKPDVVHHVTLKPVVYGSIAARFLNIRGVVNAVSGLGYNFTAGRMGAVAKMMVGMMMYGFNRDNVSVIFQNGDDEKAFRDFKIATERNNINRIKGSGVDLEIFDEYPLPDMSVIKILMPSRMLWDKGVKELKGAADILKNKYEGKIKFILAGMADEDNKAGVSATTLKEWSDGNYFDWIGHSNNVTDEYRKAHIVALPSYREGMPKSLIEATAIGRAIITTDAVGCRECVDEGINGLKVPVYSVDELANAIETLINDKEMIVDMGKASRQKAIREFDVREVIKKHLEIYNSLIE